MFINEINSENSNEFMTALKPAMREFCTALETATPYIDQEIAHGVDIKNRKLSLFGPTDPIEEYFGDVFDVILGNSSERPKKPEPEIIYEIMKITGFSKEETVLFGDRLYTDVKTGVFNGARGILVLSGETKLEDVEGSDVVPDGIFEGLNEMAEIMKGF